MLKVLADPKTTNLTLLICLGFGMDKEFKMSPLKVIDKKSIKHIYHAVNYSKAMDYIHISDTERKRDFTKNQIEKELNRMIDSGIIYFDDKKEIYVTDFFESTTHFAYVYKECWRLFFNGSSLTKKAIMFILDQMVRSLTQVVYFSKSQLLYWIQDNTELRSLAGTEYSKTLRELNKPNGFLNFMCEVNHPTKYKVNPEYACVNMIKEVALLDTDLISNLIDVGEVGNGRQGTLMIVNPR